MTFEQVTAIVGCNNDVSLPTRGTSYVNYWGSLYPGSLSPGIGIYFDGTGATVTPFAATIKKSFGI